ncbi:hypothetical protein BZA70DRAFT_117392 [Myxozyma melibiosi]|uniref:F-box domain-containing protein n=1 Tax=Myxozyma melibiosi TaxID=54550 RepID=A0ABR1FAK5_9ASCO
MQDLCEKAKKYGLSPKEWETMSYEMDCFKVVYGYTEPDGSGVRDFATDAMRQWERGRYTMFRQVLGVLAETYGVCAVTSEFMARLKLDRVMAYEITWVIKEVRARTYERFLFSELYKLITPEFMEDKINGSALESSFVCATIEAKRAGQLNADLKEEKWATLRPYFPPDDVSASPIAKMPPEVLQRILEYACIKNPYLFLDSFEEHVYKRSASTIGCVCWDFNSLTLPLQQRVGRLRSTFKIQTITTRNARTWPASKMPDAGARRQQLRKQGCFRRLD